jgi:GT2 family glycosyltransferase
VGRDLVLPSSSHPDVAVVVAGTRDAGRLERCLRAIVVAGTDGLAVQIVLCANAADRDVVELVDSAAEAVVVRSGFDLGTAAIWNMGVTAVSAPRFAIVHEDAVVEPGWLGTLWEQLEVDPAVGVAGPTIRRPNGEILSQGRVLWRDGLPWSIDPQAAPDLELAAATSVDYVDSSTMLADRSLWDELDGFDEGTFPGYTVDVDFCTGAWATGRRVVMIPTAQSVHAQGAAVVTGAGWRRSPAFRDFLVEDNMLRFRRRWAAFLADHLPYPASRPAPDAVRASLRRAADRARHPRRVEPLPSRERILTVGFEGRSVVPPEVEQRARERLEQRLHEFANWLVGELGTLREGVASLQAEFERKDQEARVAEATALAERARAEAAEAASASQQLRADGAEAELVARDTTLTWRLRTSALSLSKVESAWRTLRGLRPRGRP